jgi:hypothetical protein
MTFAALALSAALLLVQDTPAAPDTVNDAAAKAAYQAYMACLLEHAKRADDHISDANTIANGIEDACPEELRHVEDVWNAGEPPAVKQGRHMALEDGRQHTALIEVLNERRLSAGQHTPSKPSN